LCKLGQTAGGWFSLGDTAGELLLSAKYEREATPDNPEQDAAMKNSASDFDEIDKAISAA
jgi:hypothetical protein